MYNTIQSMLQLDHQYIHTKYEYKSNTVIIHKCTRLVTVCCPFSFRVKFHDTAVIFSSKFAIQDLMVVRATDSTAVKFEI